LHEEFGVDLSLDVLSQVLTAPYDFGEGTVYFFEAKINRENLQFHIDSLEVIDHQWFSKEDTLKLPVMPATQKYLQQLK
jgi:NADH pyrophosphatase NudC (nudix superfamily)